MTGSYSADEGDKTLSRGQHAWPDQATQTWRTGASENHVLQGVRDHEEPGTVDCEEKQEPEAAEIWRTHHRGRRIGERGRKPQRGMDWRPWTKRKNNQTARKEGWKNRKLKFRKNSHVILNVFKCLYKCLYGSCWGHHFGAADITTKVKSDIFTG